MANIFEFWSIEGGNTVFGRSARHDLVERNGLLGEIGLELPAVGAAL